MLRTSAALGLPSMVLKVIFWIGLGLVAGSFLRFGNTALWGGIGALLAWNLLSRGGRETIRQVIDSLAEGAKTALPVGVATALVGVIIGTMTLTGAANTFGIYIVSVGQT